MPDASWTINDVMGLARQPAPTLDGTTIREAEPTSRGGGYAAVRTVMGAIGAADRAQAEPPAPLPGYDPAEDDLRLQMLKQHEPNTTTTVASGYSVASIKEVVISYGPKEGTVVLTLEENGHRLWAKKLPIETVRTVVPLLELILQIRDYTGGLEDE